MIIERRKFLTGLFAAPFVVKSGVLMPVKKILYNDHLLMPYKGITLHDDALYYAPYIPVPAETIEAANKMYKLMTRMYVAQKFTREA